MINIQSNFQLETPIHNGSPPVFPYPWASAWGEDRYGLWMALDFKGVRTIFRWILPGKFWMGSPENEDGRADWEDRHQVTISRGFWLGETVVTQALWQAVQGENLSHFKGGNLPVEQVSWDDVQAFIEEFNRFHPALKTRLPWEAEWEYACRAGSETAFHFGNELSLDKVNYRGVWEWKSLNEWGKDAHRSTAKVKSYPCNDWGLYEMHGNVWEWCADVWQKHLGTQAQTDPWLRQDSPVSGAVHVLRGGSWSELGWFVRSAYRHRGATDLRSSHFGFRLVLGH